MEGGQKTRKKKTKKQKKNATCIIPDKVFPFLAWGFSPHGLVTREKKRKHKTQKEKENTKHKTQTDALIAAPENRQEADWSSQKTPIPPDD